MAGATTLDDLPLFTGTSAGADVTAVLLLPLGVVDQIGAGGINNTGSVLEAGGAAVGVLALFAGIFVAILLLRIGVSGLTGSGGITNAGSFLEAAIDVLALFAGGLLTSSSTSGIFLFLVATVVLIRNEGGDGAAGILSIAVVAREEAAVRRAIAGDLTFVARVLNVILCFDADM
jgi:hypothetical protein